MNPPTLTAATSLPTAYILPIFTISVDGDSILSIAQVPQNSIIIPGSSLSLNPTSI